MALLELDYAIGMEMSSAYTTIAVFLCYRWTRIPLRCFCRLWIRGFRHSAKSIILKGHSCRTEHCIGRGAERCPFNWTTDVALLYMCLMRSTKASLKP